MMGFGKQPDCRSFPELLAAYADGELDAAGRAHVEAWLTKHPEAQAIVEDQRYLSRRNRKLWKASGPIAPNEAAWAGVFGRVQDVLDAPITPASAAPSRRRFVRYTVAALATAVAIGVALYLNPSNPGPGLVTAPSPAPVEPLALATTSDIDIVSIDDRDTGALVVGRPPLTGTIVLAAVGDVDLKGIQKEPDGMVPKSKMNDAGAAPMIIAPMAGR
jgi:hypothetical protein